MNARQERFVAEYLVDYNATRAAKAAGYSAKTARQQGEQLLSKLDISQAVEKGKRERIEAAEITAEMILKGLHDEALSAESDSARVAAWSWLGKARALFTDNLKTTPAAPLRIVLEVDKD